MRIWLLGGFRVSIGPRTIEENEWRRRKAASLIKLLALAPHHRLHREQMMDLLWPELDAEAAANNLHRTLHVARHALEPQAPAADSGYLRLRGEQLELCPEVPLWVDVNAFEEAAATARHAREPGTYRAALDLYAGEFLPGDRYAAWAQDRREGLRQTYLSLLSEMAVLHEEREDYGPAIEALRKVVAEEPAHEGAHAGLMRLYALAGRRDEALGQYERLREGLSREAREPNAASRRLHGEVLADRFPPTHPPRERPTENANGERRHNLPAARTSFVGREPELVEVKRALAMTRLLTLTGAGGSGKTRLALEVAKSLAGAYPDGAWLVELAGLSHPALVPGEVAEALEVREQPGRPLTVTLADSLRTKDLLLVVDNCEHLTDACAYLVDTLLKGCPRLRILATSREALGVAGEVNWRVHPLSFPDPRRSPTVDELSSYESTRLFLERARHRNPAFALSARNAWAVAQVCERLGGIPLAIELAAARVGTLSAEQICGRLEDSLKLLTMGNRTAPPRQQTLRGALDWSYELLSEPERKLFGRLSVFVGGWTLEAAEALEAGESIEEGDVLDLLSQLADKSMVVVEAAEDGGLRYGMLEPVRQYGQEKLEESAEADAVRRWHASWYLELAKGAEPWLRGARQKTWLERLEREHDNLRAALSWALERGEAELGLWFGGALGEFWYMSGYLSEGRRWLEAALANSGETAPARTKALARAGWIAWEQGDYERSMALSEASLALSRELRDEAGAATALSNLGWAALLGNELERASTLSEEAVTLGRALGDTGGVARALLILGLVAVVRCDHERALALHEESLALARKAGDGFALAVSMAMGAFASLGRGDNQRARALCEEGLAFSQQPRVMNVTAFQLHASAALASSQGRPARSARLWGASESLREITGAILSPAELHVYGSYIDAARAGLDEAAWEEAWAEGKAMTLEEAVGYVLAEGEEEQQQARPRRPPAPKKPPAGGQPDDVLTRREWEVALLVAQGLTNRRIAGELRISERTVTTHVDHILNKLGATSRAQVAAWIVEQRMLPEEKDPG